MSVTDTHNAKILLELRREFIIEARDRLDDAQGALESIYNDTMDRTDAVTVIRRNVHSLKGMGKSFGFPTISLVSHRLEDFLAEITTTSRLDPDDIQTFLDYMDEIIGFGVDPGLSDASALVRVLPTGSQFNVENFQGREVEVLLMVPSRVVSRMVETELAQCGYRVSLATTPWEAFELAVCTLPDIIITSVVMDHISGAELARALSEVSAVRNTQFAVLTSFEPGHVELQGIPQKVDIIGLGASFHDDLGDFVAKFESKPSTIDQVEYQSSRPLRILLAEDMRANRLLVDAVLSKFGIEMVMVQNGALAVEAVREQNFDVVLMDIMMPEMDGLDATRAIRALPGDAANVPIIALTANDSEQDREDYIQRGMNDLVPKPIISGDLIRAIERRCDVVLHSGASKPTSETDPAALNPVGDSLKDLEAFAAKL
jgi:CheY-like chemotaxis protein/HPt (histidine-containing phosphotransfer) domain-containing protein